MFQKEQCGRAEQNERKLESGRIAPVGPLSQLTLILVTTSHTAGGACPSGALQLARSYEETDFAAQPSRFRHWGEVFPACSAVPQEGVAPLTANRRPTCSWVRHRTRGLARAPAFLRALAGRCITWGHAPVGPLRGPARCLLLIPAGPVRGCFRYGPPPFCQAAQPPLFARRTLKSIG